MFKRILSLFRSEETATSELVLQRDVQALRLDLEEREREIAQLKAEIQRLRSTANSQITDAVQDEVEQLFRDAASPVAQLSTQAYLLEVADKPVQARDVLAVARRLVQMLQDHGAIIEEEIGATVSFDPNRHTPLAGNVMPKAGQKVVVRMVGISYKGKIVQKAGVELAE